MLDAVEKVTHAAPYSADWPILRDMLKYKLDEVRSCWLSYQARDGVWQLVSDS